MSVDRGDSFNADGGHHFDVIAESDNELKPALFCSVPGLSTGGPASCQRHMKKKILTGTESRMAGFMFILRANAFPGGIYLLKDEPGQTKGVAEEIFTPDTDQQRSQHQYTLCRQRRNHIL